MRLRTRLNSPQQRSRTLVVHQPSSKVVAKANSSNKIMLKSRGHPVMATTKVRARKTERRTRRIRKTSTDYERIKTSYKR